MESFEILRKKIDDAAEIKSIVRTMKAMAASNIGQYVASVAALDDYYRTVVLGLTAYFHRERIAATNGCHVESRGGPVCAVVFGSDQGLVGQFNNRLSELVSRNFPRGVVATEIWAVGERVGQLVADAGFEVSRLFTVPNSVASITPLVGRVLSNLQENGTGTEVFIVHNRPRSQSAYEPVCERFLPLDERWGLEFAARDWVTKRPPEIAGDEMATLLALIREYLFVSLFKACAESLAAENSSRLKAMQRAEKKIAEMLDDLKHRYHRRRQTTIDEELFDVIAGFEVLK